MSRRPPYEFEESTLHLGELRRAQGSARFDVHFFRDFATETTAMAISTGDLTSNEVLPIRVHSSCLTSEALGGRDCDCAEQLRGALSGMAQAGRGVVFYLLQEGRGAGLTAKARDRMMVQASRHRLNTFEAYAAMGLPADLRRYDAIAPMSRRLGLVAPIRLLTNNPEKAEGVRAALASEKLEVVETTPVRGASSPFNQDYLQAKHETGHRLEVAGEAAAALPPETVEVFDPFELEGDPRRIVTASYFLPVALPSEIGPDPEIRWFRSTILFDRDREREDVVLSLGGATPEASVSASAESGFSIGLLDRLPFRDAHGRRALVAALTDLARSGEGAIRVRFDERDRADVSP